MIQLKAIAELVKDLNNHQNILRAVLLDVAKLNALLVKFSRKDNNPERELSKIELFELAHFALVEFRTNHINFYEPPAQLKDIISAIGTENLGFMDFLFCSKNPSESLFIMFYEMKSPIKKELTKILNTLLFDGFSLNSEQLKRLLENIGNDVYLEAFDKLVKGKKIPIARMSEFIGAMLETSYPIQLVNIVFYCLDNKIELSGERLTNLKRNDARLPEIYAIIVNLKANQDQFDCIVIHKSLPVLAQLMHHICGSGYYKNLLSFSTQNLHLDKATLAKFLYVEAIDSWLDALKLLSRHRLMVAPAVIELFDNPHRVPVLARMSTGSCEAIDVEKVLYGGKDLNNANHLSRWQPF